ncbi:MAG: Gfo/Idh/MocA family oxidoreductase, partial [Planctomycetaceae bacterium]
YDRHPRARKFVDYRRMFDQMESQIDAVVVSTPDHTHFHPCMSALERGKHLYCEKPMAHAVAEVRAMTELAKKMKVATQLGVQRHTLNNVHRVVELVRSGAIGQVSEVYSWVGGTRGMPAVPQDTPPAPASLKWDLWLGGARQRPYSPAYAPYNWRFWWDFGTGETGNWGCHILDIPYWALGLKYPSRVDATGPKRDPHRASKSMQTRFVFPAEGDRPEVILHWDHTSNGPEILKQYGLSPKQQNTLFVGSEGMLLCGFGSRKLYPQEKFQDFKAPDRSLADSPGFHREWISACHGGPPATCEFGYSGPLTETVLLGNTAYRAGGGFDWDHENMVARGNAKADPLLRPTYRKGWEVASSGT